MTPDLQDVTFRAALEEVGAGPRLIERIARECQEPDLDDRLRHAVELLNARMPPRGVTWRCTDPDEQAEIPEGDMGMPAERLVGSDRIKAAEWLGGAQARALRRLQRWEEEHAPPAAPEGSSRGEVVVVEHREPFPLMGWILLAILAIVIISW